MLPADAKIISVDDHDIEHPRVWLDRLPAKYADVAPASHASQRQRRRRYLTPATPTVL